MAEHRLRPALAEDAAPVARLLHESAIDMYRRFAGDRGSAIRILEASFRRAGTGASREVVTVAESDGEVIGALAAFPASEIDGRGRRFLRLLLVRTPPWTWPRSIRLYRLGGRLAPAPPTDSYYVDALATDARCRRTGVGTALLEQAEAEATRLGLASVALETGDRNAVARALYESAGFTVAEERTAQAGMPGFVAYVKLV